MTTPTKIQIAHSPDSDDAFMFYAIEEKKIDIKVDDRELEGILDDIETLNKKAFNKEYDATAISFHTYPYIAKDYYLMSTGASIGYKYGPVIVAKENAIISPGNLKGKKIAIPGKFTTAYLLLRLFEPDFEAVDMPFDEIMDAVLAGTVDCGLIIHEGQVTYKEQNLIKILDLGEWWFEKTKLPTPLGCNVVKKSIGKEAATKISEILRMSIVYSMEHKEAAINYAAKFGRGLDIDKVVTFVDMYVNERTIEYSEDDLKAIKLLLKEGYDAGIIPNVVELEIV